MQKPSTIFILVALLVVPTVAAVFPAPHDQEVAPYITGAHAAWEQVGAAGIALADRNVPGPGILGALDPLLRAHEGAVGHLVPDVPVHATTRAALAEQTPWLETAQQLSNAPTSVDPTDAVSTLLSLQTRPESVTPLPALPHFQSLADALHATYIHYGAGPDPAARAAIDAYRDLPPDVADPVTRIIEAHLQMSAATRLAFQNPTDGLPFDAGLLLDGRDQLAKIVMEQAPLLRPSSSDMPYLSGCEVVLFDPNGSTNFHGCDAPLIIDLAGNDFYSNNAGGNLQVGESALLVDTDGWDVYACTRSLSALNGAGNLGAGHLFDLAGNDEYRPQKTVEAGIDGGAVSGSGLLVDLAGDDKHLPNATGGATTGGAVDGFGAYIDLAGDDSIGSVLAGPGAANGGSVGAAAQGLLADLAGHDSYGAAIDGNGSANGATLGGRAVLLDLAGTGPEPEAHQFWINGTGAANGAAVGGWGLLYDATGNDEYDGTITGAGAANGAALRGVGTLLDLATPQDTVGDSFYHASVGGLGASNGAAYGSIPDGQDQVLVPGGIGLLVSNATGGSSYQGNGLTQGAGSHYGVGVLLASLADDSFHGADDSFAQGAGRQGGVGLLLDPDGDAWMILDGGAGQARGSQGAGLLVLPSDGTTTYTTAFAASAFSADGGGFALFNDGGTSHFQEASPDPSCRTAELTPMPVSGQGVRICAPMSGGVPIIDPLTGEPVGPAPKAGIPCSSTQVGSIDCGDEVGNLLGPDAVPWLESSEVATTASGGLQVLGYQPAAASPVETVTLHIDSFDRICDAGCAAL